MMAGIDLVPRETQAVGVAVCDRIRSHGVILRPLGEVVVWMPPLTLTAEDLGLLERATASAISEVAEHRP